MQKLLKSETALHVFILAFAASLLFVETIFYGMAYRGTGDAWLNGLPLYKYTLEQLAQFHFPLWNPYLASGYNYLGDPMSPAFDWTMWLIAPFSHSKIWFLHMLSLRLYLLVAASGVLVYLGLKAIVNPLPALFGASVFMLSPAAMWFLSGIGQIPGLLHGAMLFYLIMTEERRSHLRGFCLLALTVGSMFLAGHLAGCAFVWISILIVRLFMRRPEFPTRVLTYVAAAFAGVMLASIRLAPMIIAGFSSNRIQQDPASFIQQGVPSVIARTLVPEFLGYNWSALGPIVAMPFEWCNLSYFGLVGMGALLTAALANREFAARNRMLLWTYLLSLLAVSYVPFVYQTAASILSPLVTGETLYFNFLFPPTAAMLVALGVQSLTEQRLTQAAARPVFEKAIMVMTALLLAFTAFLPYYTSLVSVNGASLVLKGAVMLLLAAVLFRMSARAVKVAVSVLLLAGLAVIGAQFFTIADWIAQNSLPKHAAMFFTNANLILCALAVALPIMIFGSKLPAWFQLGLPAAVAVAALIWAAGDALVPYNIHEFPDVLPHQVSSITGVFRFVSAGLAVLLCLSFILSKKWPLQNGLYLLLILQLADLTGHAKNFVASAAMPFKPADEIFSEAWKQGDRVDERFTSAREALTGMIDNLPAWYKIRVAGAYLNFAPKEYVELAGVLLEQKFANQFRWTVNPENRFAELTASNDFIEPKTFAVYSLRDPQKRIFRATVVFQSQILAEPNARVERLASKDFPSKDAVVLEEGQPQYFSEPAQKAEIVSDTHDRMEFRARIDRPGIFLLRDSFDGGWSAEINGASAPILKANHAFMALRLQPGDNVIKFRFWPRGFTLGIALSCVAAVLLALAALLGSLGILRF